MNWISDVFEIEQFEFNQKANLVDMSFPLGLAEAEIAAYCTFMYTCHDWN